MADDLITCNDIFLWFKEYFGETARGFVLLSNRNIAQTLLYGTFVVGCHVDSERKIIESGVWLDQSHTPLKRYFGKQLPQGYDKDTVFEGFAIIDYYCRMRLPDKFLSEFERTKKK